MAASLSLNEHQLRLMSCTERVASVISIVCISFIFVTFLSSPRFNKPINRLVFFASWGNLGVNIASLISEAGPNAGQNSRLCQFQAVLVQIFLGVDAFWALCMACNVYLAIFHKYTTKQLRSLDKWYLVGCYGASCVPAFAYIGVSTQKRGRVYGPAVIWCWVVTEWDFLRIATLYGIVWVAVISAFAIYCLAGVVIWRKRDQLQGYLNPLNENPFVSTITTEIEVTTEIRAPSQTSGHVDEDVESGGRGYGPRTVIASGPQHGRRPSRPNFHRMLSITKDAPDAAIDPAAWLYARVAFLFFMALLITWGFWNTVVYILTSKSACRQLWDDTLGRGRTRSGRPHPTTDSKDNISLRRLREDSEQRTDNDFTSVVSSAKT
ncbi:hypothetical protein MMC20_001984 [Loxospora ochrophaea]|nr:hypothetical protein [Loxospora ochrophaea]